jgi:tripartite-type tricarboxylate transporter receptor subunit TctC
VVAPAATPAAAIAKLDEALGQTMRTDEFRQRLLQQGYEPIDAPAPVLASMIRADIAKFGTLVRSTGIKGGQ